MRTKCGTILAAAVALAAVADGGAPRLFTMDMVHHNPGDKPTESRFLDPDYLAEMGTGAKVVNDFRYPQCACTFEEFDESIFPAGSEERKWVDDFAAECEAKARACHEKGLECHYFMDIIVLPRRLIEKYRSEICDEDGRVSFTREKTWEIHRLMVREMLRRIPSVDGYVIRTGEMYSHNVPYHGGNTPLDFRKPLDGFVDTHAKLMNLLREEICVKGGKKVFYRTWDFRRFHIRPDLYLAITDQVEPHEKLFLSIKHTAGDYLRYVPFNPTLGIGKHKQIVEVQCQREYEGKGAYPNYVVKGVVEGFEENAACPGIQGLGDFLKDSRFAGVWTWSRGGGWEGPYLKNELWCAMNAFVMTEWAKHPEAGEEAAFGKFMDRIGVAAESRGAFRKLAVLSAEAVVRGMGYMPDEKLTACWTRDHFIGGFGDPELDADANRLVKESKVAASLANRRAAVERWREIVRLADSVKIADKAAESYVRVSSRYGLHLYRIYEAGWTAMLLMRQREVSCKTDEKEIAAAVKRYDEAWRDYRALAADPQCATLFDGHFAEYHISQDHNSIDPAPGMDAEVDKARRFLNGELLRCDGLVTEKTPGWRFEASGAKGGAAFNPLEGWYPDKGGKLVSPRIAIPKAGAYYKLSFTGFAPVRSYETVVFYDAAGNMIADNYDVLYPGETNRYERVVFAQEGVAEAEVFFQSPKGCTVRDVKFEPATAEEAAKWCDGVYAKLPPLEFSPQGNPLALAPKTLDALKMGTPWRILMLGDSIMQDTFHSQFHALVKRAYPKSDVTWLVSVRGSTGCWYYCEPENFRKYVADYKPDCVFIGGISGWIHPEMPLNGGSAIESVARRVNEELGAEVIVMTPTLAIDLRVPKGTEQGTSVAPAKFDHAAIGDKAWKYDVAAAEELKAICAKNGWPLWDMFRPAYDWLFKTGLPSEFYSRDYVHSGELGKQLIARVALAYFAAAGAKDNMTADAIVNGVHGYMPDNYVVPKEPEVRERLEWFKDQKLALMMHFGMYSQMGVFESWPLSDADSSWSRVQIDWTDDAEAFKRQYWDLWKSFNPVRFQPEKWARLAKDGGFRYLVFTTKHHDGFCLFDTKYTDFKVTNPECPFSKNPRADIVKSVFDAFRAEGLGIAAYFSKPDWHNEDFWENRGIGRKVSRMPTYDVKANPEKWARFREFTKNQIVELVRDYGPVDVIWLDGGQVQRKTGLDIGIEDIIAEARKYKPDLISADRTAGGSCENVITPEQTVPPEPLAVPWESCITMGTGFSYRYDDTYKSPRELVHLLLDVVAKGGNLALNVAPGPDGRLPEPAIERMEALGAWLKANGDSIYATRPAAPFADGNWRFTGAKDGKAVFAFRLWKDGERDLLAQTIPVAEPEKVTRVVHLGTGLEVPFSVTDKGIAIRLPETFRTNPYADGFAISVKRS